MIPYFHKTPQWLSVWYPSMTWQKPTESKVIHLTFDDGPIPSVTPYVLEILSDYQAEATFFCVGENVRKHPEVFEEVKSGGHAFGNHTYHHLNGWDSSSDEYWEDVLKCEDVMKRHAITPTLFRPPHGRIRKDQRVKIEERYEIIMWSHLSGDFDAAVNIDKSFNVIKKAANGSILVFHDSLKAENNLKKLLPDVMSYFQDEGYEFKSL